MTLDRTGSSVMVKREKEERPLKKQRGKNESHTERSYDTELAA